VLGLCRSGISRRHLLLCLSAGVFQLAVAAGAVVIIVGIVAEVHRVTNSSPLRGHSRKGTCHAGRSR
jgi:hypothetical protein